jgi:signal transduction histidine kinase
VRARVGHNRPVGPSPRGRRPERCAGPPDDELLAARADERRRVRRDLHDGLGPALAGIALQLDVAHDRLRSDRPGVDVLLADLAAQTRSAIADLRRLVNAEAPTVLDGLDLAAALREQARRFPGLTVEVITTGDLAELPTVVETAAYWIATEAIANAARHAGAQRCTVRLELDGELQLEISDDGSGMPADWLPGLGLTSIHERAAALGGSCSVAPHPAGGTMIQALLPMTTG